MYSNLKDKKSLCAEPYDLEGLWIDLRIYSKTPGCESLLLSKPLSAHAQRYTPSSSMHQCHSWQFTFFHQQTHAYHTLLTHIFQQKLHQNQGQPTTPTAHAKQPSHLTGTDPSCAGQCHAPSCARTAQLTRQLIPQLTSPSALSPPLAAPQQNQAGTGEVSPDKIRQQRATIIPSAAMLISWILPKHGVETPMGPVMLPLTLLSLQVMALNKATRTSHPKE